MAAGLLHAPPVSPMLASVLTPAGGLGPERLVWLALVVFVGAVVPVVPTGAAVSATAVLAGRNPGALVVVVVCGAAGAWAGDVVTLVLVRWGGGRLLGTLIVRLRRSGGRAAGLPDRLQRHDLRVLIVSRLVPGARIPVLLAVAGGALEPRRFARHDVTACSIWSVLYSAVGIAGRSIFGSPTLAIVVAVAFVVVVSYVVGRLEERTTHGDPARGTSRRES